MNVIMAIRIIGASHLLQPPLTALLARRLGLRDAFANLPKLPAQIAVNMGIASVALPTSLGCLVGIFAGEAAGSGGMRALAWLLAAFWTWRLGRQRVLGRDLSRAWHWTLAGVFVVQGPLFALLLAWVALRAP